MIRSRYGSADGDLDAQLLSATGYLVHPRLRQPLLALHDLSCRAQWPLEAFITYFKSTMKAYGSTPVCITERGAP